MRRPAGVVVIAILYWIGAFWLLVLGVILTVGATLFTAALAGIPSIIGGLGIVGGVFMLAFGTALAFIGYGLVTLQEWARMTAVVLAVIGIVICFLPGIGIFGRLIRLAINIAIVWYLNQAPVKACFLQRA